MCVYSVVWRLLHVWFMFLWVFFFSGESVPLWLCEVEEHAHSLSHAWSERCDLWCTLWELQSPVYTGDDQVCCVCVGMSPHSICSLLFQNTLFISSTVVTSKFTVACTYACPILFLFFFYFVILFLMPALVRIIQGEDAWVFQ